MTGLEITALGLGLLLGAVLTTATVLRAYSTAPASSVSTFLAGVLTGALVGIPLGAAILEFTR